MAAEHAFRDNSPRRPLGLFARLFDLVDGEIDHELVAGFFVDGWIATHAPLEACSVARESRLL